MVDRDVEETLNLVCMQIHGNQTVDACYAQQVSYQFGTDRHTRLVLTVLTRPSEIGKYGDDTLGRCAFGRINHQQEFHQVV